jgi:hypothetical protein
VPPLVEVSLARLFISCNNRDLDFGKQLQSDLLKFEHEMTLAVDALPAGRWEEKLLRGLHQADAFIGLLTPNGQESDWVVAQTGMAISCEYARKMLVLPVCPKDEIPNFVAAFHCFWSTVEKCHPNENLAAELHEAIQTYTAGRTPRIFICHRHHNANIASALIDLLRSAFEVEDRDIRCTSVPGFRLPVGSKSADSIQADLEGADVVVGLIGPQTGESDYVLFELGASWGLRKPTFPVRAAGASFEHVPEVLRERSSLELSDVRQCLQLVEDISRVTSIKRKQLEPGGAGEIEMKKMAEELATASRPNRSP